MLTFSSLGSGSYRITGGDKAIVAFAANGKGAPKDAITLLAVPEETASTAVISWPGEYNEAGISLRGVGHSEGQQVSYVVEVDGVRCGLLSSPLKDWSDKQIEASPDIDVLVIPAGDAKLVQKLVDEFDPRVLIVLPGKEKGDAEAVVKAVGVKETVSEYKVKGLPAEGREAVMLK